MPVRSSTLIVWNPSAGSTAAGAEVRRTLEAKPDCSVVETASRDAALHTVAVACDDGCRRVIAAGGDGTANVVLQALADHPRTDVEMAVLPLGTGNDLARTLGMPLEPELAAEAVFGRDLLQADVFRCSWSGGQRVIANMCTAGNTGVYLQKLTPEIKQRWGPFCYLRGVVDVLTDMQTFDVELQWPDGVSETMTVLNLFAANGRTTGAGMPISPSAQLDDGLIDVVIVQDGEPGEIASLTANYLLADFLQHPLVVHRQVRSLKLRPAQSLPTTIDGDNVTESPREIAADSRKLPLVYVPAANPANATN
jgi:diacylglycerol kinase (ATP)